MAVPPRSLSRRSLQFRGTEPARRQKVANDVRSIGFGSRPLTGLATDKPQIVECY